MRRGGEVVFNTSLTGYQEVFTDPSYAGQIVCLTYPHIGNVGANLEDEESSRPCIESLIVREFSQVSSNWRSAETAQLYLNRHKIPVIWDIDTRALVRHIRSVGALRGMVSTPWSEQMGESDAEAETRRHRVVAYDYGIKQNILRLLVDHHCEIYVVPAQTSAEDVLAMKPDGVFLSNGPGDPEPMGYAVENVRKMIGHVPIFGICLGHQVCGLALGGKTFKLKFGHHGSNHPVKNLLTEQVEITAQNHGFCVDPESLPSSKVEITHVNLNDHTNEGMRHKSLPLFSVQYHPEASPGPHDSHYLFTQFTDLMKEFAQPGSSRR